MRQAGGAWKLAGALPTAWFPSGVAVDSAGALRVITIKGVADTSAGNGTFNSLKYRGSLERIPAPADAQSRGGHPRSAGGEQPAL